MEIEKIAQRTKDIVAEITLWPKRLQRAFLAEWLSRVGRDAAFLEEVVREAQTAYATSGYSRNDDRVVQKWMREELERDPSVKPGKLTDLCLAYFNIPASMWPYYKQLADKEKERKRARDKKRMQRATSRVVSHLVKTQAANPAVEISEDQTIEEVHGADTEKDSEENILDAETFDADPILRSAYTYSDLRLLIEPYKSAASPSLYQRLLDAAAYIARHGERCPSIYIGRRSEDRECNDFRQVPDLFVALRKISVLDHTFFVTKYVVDVAKERRFDAVLILQAIAAALLHDAGKTEWLDKSGIYMMDARGDHAFGSAELLKDMFLAENLPLYDKIVSAVEVHHDLPGNNIFAEVLCEAERRARNLEIGKSTAFDPKDLEQWFNVRDFLELLRGRINTFFAGKKYLFNFFDVVYCSPDVLRAAARDLMIGALRFDISIIRSADSDKVLKKIVAIIRNAGIIHGYVKPPYFGRSFRLTFKNVHVPGRTLYLLPLQLPAFGMTIDQADSTKKPTQLVSRIHKVRSTTGIE